jgi:hypothetical protein
MNTAVINRVPVSITANTAQDLSALMLELNHRTQRENRYFDIQFVKGQWVAWYLQDIAREIL